jgi:hypothetical protein
MSALSGPKTKLISDQRWYMFQNMGPAPTPRSGHAMVAAHGKVFVVGGEANASSAAGRDDPSLVHILDSCKSFFFSRSSLDCSTKTDV